MPETVTRAAIAADARAIDEIYAEGVAGRLATFTTSAPGARAIETRIESGELIVVAERDGEVVGAAWIADYSIMPAYSGVAEYTIYVKGTAQNKGVGTTLLRALCDAARAAGRHKLIGRIITVNAASVALALRCGFREVGVHRCHGKLDGEWRDVVVVEKSLPRAASEPGSGPRPRASRRTAS